MGRLEKKIIAAALALVGIMVCVVVYRGLDQHSQRALEGASMDLSASWNDPADRAETPPTAPTSAVATPGEALVTAVPPTEDAAAPPQSRDPLEPLLAIPALASGDSAAAGSAEALEAQPLDLDQLWDEEVRTCKVLPGDTLIRIARREVGTSVQAVLDEIRLLNEGLREDRLMPGQEIQLPGARRVAALTAAAKEPAALTVPSAPPAGAARGGRRHTVVAGDTLWGLAQKYYGNGALKDRIYEANRASLGDQDVLRIGMVLVIPEK